MNKTKLSQNETLSDSNHTSADCKKLRELKSTGLAKGTRNGKGKGKRTNSSHSATRTNPSFKKGKGYGGGKGKDKGNRINSGTTLNSFKDMECSHCGKKGHPARNCYKRLNATTPKLSQNTTVVNEPPTTIAFQQFVTYVKRKADKQESDAEKDQHDVGDPPSSPPATDLPLALTDAWGSSSASVAPTWGRTNNEKNEEGQHEWYEESSSAAEPNRYSPEQNAFRSVTCDCCDKNVRTRKMNGIITCHTCTTLYFSSPLRVHTNKPSKEVLHDNEAEQLHR